MRILTSLQILSVSLLTACAASEDGTKSALDSGAAGDATPGDGSDDWSDDDYLDMDGVDNSMCSDQYSICGDILIPPSIIGEARSLAMVLYSTVPPAGPPDGIVAEISGPDIMGGYRFPIREVPVLFSGEYYLWVNLYMEGGGEWVPVNGVDYTGYAAEPVVLDGSPASFQDITLELASGW